MNHSKVVQPKPHRKDSPSWKAIKKVLLLSYSWTALDLCRLASLLIHTGMSFENMSLLLNSDSFASAHLTILTLQIQDSGEELGLRHFKPIKPLGSGDTGR